MVNSRRTMTYHPDLDQFVRINDLELRKIVAYWLNNSHYTAVDADDDYTRSVWHDLYIFLKNNETLKRYNPDIAPIWTYMWHVIKNGVRKVEYSKYRKHRPTDKASELQEEDATVNEENTLNYHLDINTFLNEVHNYTCMRIPCNVFKDVLAFDRKYAARKHRISKHKVSLYLGRIREVYMHYQSGCTGIEYWKREFDS